MILSSSLACALVKLNCICNRRNSVRRGAVKAGSLKRGLPVSSLSSVMRETVRNSLYDGTMVLMATLEIVFCDGTFFRFLVLMTSFSEIGVSFLPDGESTDGLAGTDASRHVNHQNASDILQQLAKKTCI